MAKSDIKIALIAAMDQNRVIGKQNELPWHIPEDFQNLKKITMGKPLIMGRKTFESIGKPLPGRLNIVLSRHPDESKNGENLLFLSSMNDALAHAEQWAEENGSEEMIIFGGRQIYEMIMPIVEIMYLTQVETKIENGEAFFPEFSTDVFKKTSSTPKKADHPLDYSFDVWERI